MKQNRDTFILDTNILLYDPEAIYSFENSEILIPISVIEELDEFKKNQSETGRNSRELVLILDHLRSRGDLAKGVELKNGSTLRIFAEEKPESSFPEVLDLKKSSNKILAIALYIQQNSLGRAVLVSNNINLRIRASVFGLEVIAYETEHPPKVKKLYEEIQHINITSEQFQTLVEKEEVEVSNEELHPNQHVLVSSEEGKKEPLLARYYGNLNRLKTLQDYSEGVWKILPRNQEQAAALDVLMDPSIHIAILAGKAGTGKTLLALAAALESMLNHDSYRKIIVSRPVYPMGRDLGFLPGDLEEKIAPWMQPIFDNLEYLSAGTSKGKEAGYKQMLEKGLIELEALSLIRGRSIQNRFMIVDESQNLTPHEIKTIITRAGEGTKLVLTGDPHQIDNPYVDFNSNGLSYVIEKLKPHSIAAHVNLFRGERSKLAELAANVL